ncbi:MAG: cytochrome c [Planctomycetia bacterium]|nr:cytochrome c [Planctomycetia bacterium]
MRRHDTILLVIVAALLGMTWLLPSPSSRADEETKSTEKAAAKDKPGVKKTVLRAFMQKKLAASQSVLEGLAVEDFDLIAEGAKQLKTTAGAAEFMVLSDAEYLEHANDFRRIVNKLAVAAKEKRLDGATLAFLDVTMSCVDCHQHVRNAPVDK